MDVSVTEVGGTDVCCAGGDGEVEDVDVDVDIEDDVGGGEEEVVGGYEDVGAGDEGVWLDTDEGEGEEEAADDAAAEEEGQVETQQYTRLSSQLAPKAPFWMQYSPLGQVYPFLRITKANVSQYLLRDKDGVD